MMKAYIWIGHKVRFIYQHAQYLSALTSRVPTRPSNTSVAVAAHKMTQFSTVSHVIFDLDGLLLDTEKLYIQASKEICQLYDKEYTWRHKEHTFGWFGIEAATYVVKDLNLPISAEDFYDQARQKYKSLFPSATLMPGAERLIRHFHTKGIPIAIATSSSRESVDLKTTNHKELFTLFKHLVSGSSDPEVKKGKPAPDIFTVCASKFPDNPTPKKVLVFEDAPNGVLAAKAAGMQVVMVPDSQVEEEKRRAATLVLGSLADFKPELFGLPAF